MLYNILINLIYSRIDLSPPRVSVPIHARCCPFPPLQISANWTPAVTPSSFVVPEYHQVDLAFTGVGHQANRLTLNPRYLAHIAAPTVDEIPLCGRLIFPPHLSPELPQ